MSTVDTSSPVDFAIVTALPVERDAIRDRLDGYEVVQEPTSPYTYYLGQVELPGNDEPYRVVVLMLNDPGNVEAAIGATMAISRWQPEHVIMLGIAGGIAKGGVKRGDVVIARHVHYYEPGKVRPYGEQRRADQYFSDRLLWGRAQAYDAADWREEVLVAPPTKRSGFMPSVHFGPIASGEMVIADEAALDRLRQESPKLLAVAMEGAGVARAVSTVARRFIEIRGISDLANAKKDDRWHTYAAHAAAAFVVGFLRSHPVPTLGQSRRSTAPSTASEPPLVILRAQSLRSIGPGELIADLPEPLRHRDHSTVALDFVDLASQTKLLDPEEAVARLMHPEGGLVLALMAEEGELVFHGLVAIPLAFAAGYLVSDRQPVRLFDYHPDIGNWRWPEDRDPPPLEITGLSGERRGEAGEMEVRISVTLPVLQEATRSIVPEPLASIELSVPESQRNLIRHESQVRDYGARFRQVLDAIRRDLPQTTRIHVFYSGPVSLAFHLGQQVSENIHPPVTVWNYSRGYDWGIDLEAVSRGEVGLVRGAP